jgi:DNA ligase-1
VDSETGDIRSFQELAGRARRDVKASNVKVAICVYLFDLMLLNDQARFIFYFVIAQVNGIWYSLTLEQILLQQPFRERRTLLRITLPPFDSATVEPIGEHPASDLGAAALLHARMAHVESVENSAGREAVEEFWERAVESKCEGLMIKARLPSLQYVKNRKINLIHAAAG